MAILSNGWYKGSLAKEEITEISVAAAGSGGESWDGSAAQDGSILCYRSGTKVIIVCDRVTAVEERTFLSFFALKKISGLGSVTTIGDYGFYYTPNLASIDLVPGNLTSIGASAFRMSGVEDTLDLSAVPLSSVGDMATRHKRWGSSELGAVQGVAFPKTIYLDVPNPDDQRNYPHVPIATQDGTVLYADEWGCTTFAAYHMWNCMNAGTEKQYDNWLDWYHSTLNSDGRYAQNNHLDDQTEPDILAKLGWTNGGTIRIADEAQLQTILDRLAVGYPTYAVIYSSGDYTHAIVINGCDTRTHKLSVVDYGRPAWIAFEDMFTSGAGDQDRIMLIDFQLPILASKGTWFTQGGTAVQKSSITEIHIQDTYAPVGTVTSSWDASGAKDGSVMAYVEGTKLTLAGNGSGKIRMNADSSDVFNGFSKMTSFNGANVLFAAGVITLAKAFYDCMVLRDLDLRGWNISNVTNLESMFNGMLALESIHVSGWNTANVTNMATIFMCCPKLTELDLTGWTTENVTTLNGIFGGVADYGGAMALTKIIGLENWDTGKVTNMQSVFQNCPGLETLEISNWNTGACTNMAYMFAGGSNITCHLKQVDVSNWDTGSVTTLNTMFQNQADLVSLDVSKWNTGVCTNMSYMFCGCTSLGELDLSNWDTTNVTTLQNMLLRVNSLEEITLGEKFSVYGNGSLTGAKVAVIPTPSRTYIDGADGNWYDVSGNAVAPSAVPDKAFGVYYATPAIAEEDMNQMVLVKKGNLMKTAAAIRRKTGSIKGYAPAEFAEAILSSK